MRGWMDEEMDRDMRRWRDKEMDGGIGGGQKDKEMDKGMGWTEGRGRLWTGGLRPDSGQPLLPPPRGHSQVSMSADANFPVAPKWIRMNFPWKRGGGGFGGH